MNCESFDRSVSSLVRGDPMDEALRAAAQHAGACSRCALRLQEEQHLSAALTALRAQTAGGNASASREASVLAAFRAHHALRPARRIPARWWVAAGAAAAAAVILWIAIPRRAGVQAPKQVAERVLPPPAPKIAQQEKKPVTIAARARQRATRKRPVPPPVENEPALEASERGTEFIPIPYTPAMTPYDRGQVVRVRLPRSSMRSVGLPVNEDPWLDRVHADVLLGEDGIARAIRFVSNR